jgi:hypothetical protein
MGLFSRKISVKSVSKLQERARDLQDLLRLVKEIYPKAKAEDVLDCATIMPRGLSSRLEIASANSYIADEIVLEAFTSFTKASLDVRKFEAVREYLSKYQDLEKQGKVNCREAAARLWVFLAYLIEMDYSRYSR